MVFIPIYKRCSRCGARLGSGSKCPCQKERHKEYDHYNRNKQSKDFYNSTEWMIARKQAIEKDEGIDVYAYMTKGEILAADTVHHIIPLKDDWNRRIDIQNLMSLHHDTHSLIEQLYKKNKERTEKEMKRMLERFRAMTHP